MNSLDPFSSLCDFIRREDDGRILQDPAYRAYSLERRTGAPSLARAIRRVRRTTLDELRADLDNIGVNSEGLQARLIRWHTLYRLNRGELSKRALRKHPLQPE